ncbi:MAG: hypothetical protein NVS1B11_20010 [Terriglobales bacterium]
MLNQQAITKCSLAVYFFLLSGLTGSALAQQTIFNIPSGDVLDKGKIYGEFDSAYFSEHGSGTYTPRVVAGIGHRCEIGLNLNGISSPDTSRTTLSPILKCKAYDGGKNGWSFLVGDGVFIPAQNRSYKAGNYFYVEFTKTLKTQTRVTLGAFDFTSDIVAHGNKAGGQFGIEQPAGKRVTLAADWFTGKHGAGYFTPGAVLKLSARGTAYAGYEIGNHAASSGNRALLFEIGWNFN